MTIEEIYEKVMNDEPLAVSKKAMRELGTNPAVLLACVEGDCEIGEEKAFTQEYLQDRCNLSVGQQRRCIKRLQDTGYIKVMYDCYKRRYITLLKKAEV